MTVRNVSICMMAFLMMLSVSPLYGQDEPDKQIYAIKWSHDSTMIAIGDEGNAQIYAQNNDEITHHITFEEAYVVEFSWSSDDKFLTFATSDTRIFDWDLDSNKSQMEIPQLQSPGIVGSLLWGTEDRLIFIGQLEGNPNIYIWDAEQNLFIFEELQPSVTEFMLSPDKSTLAISYMIPHIELIDPNNFEQQGFIGESLDALRTRFIVNPVQNAISHIDWKPDGRFIVSGSVDGIVTIWDVDTGDVIYEYNLSPDEVDFATAQLRFFRDIWFSASGNTFGGIQADGAYHIWDSETGVELANFELNSHTILAEISPDKTRLAYVDEENELHVVAVYDLLREQLNTTIGECVADESIEDQLTDMLENELESFVTAVEANRDTFEQETCADELLGLAEALRDTPLPQEE